MLTLELSPRVAEIVRGVDGWATTSEDATAMHIALVNPLGLHQRGAVKMLRVRTTPGAWEALLSLCAQWPTVWPGDTAQEQADATVMHRAGASIHREMARLANHPAFRGNAVVGTSPVSFEAWRYGTEGRWWPSKAIALQRWNGEHAELHRAILRPQQVRTQGRVFTTWEPRDS